MFTVSMYDFYPLTLGLFPFRNSADDATRCALQVAVCALESGLLSSALLWTTAYASRRGPDR